MFSASGASAVTRTGRPRSAAPSVGRDDRGGAAHVLAHQLHAVARLDRDAAGVERDALADEHDVRAWRRPGARPARPAGAARPSRRRRRGGRRSPRRRAAPARAPSGVRPSCAAAARSTCSANQCRVLHVDDGVLVRSRASRWPPRWPRACVQGGGQLGALPPRRARPRSARPAASAAAGWPSGSGRRRASSPSASPRRPPGRTSSATRDGDRSLAAGRGSGHGGAGGPPAGLVAAPTPTSSTLAGVAQGPRQAPATAPAADIGPSSVGLGAATPRPRRSGVRPSRRPATNREHQGVGLAGGVETDHGQARPPGDRSSRTWKARRYGGTVPAGSRETVSRRSAFNASPSALASSGVISTTSRPPPSSGTRMTMPRPSLVTSSGPSPVRGFIAAMLSPLRPRQGRWVAPQPLLPSRPPHVGPRCLVSDGGLHAAARGRHGRSNDFP